MGTLRGAVRVCVDLKKSVLREPHPIPSVDDTLAHLTGATVFSKVDANSGFWQIPLSEETRHYTTFITPYGRYQFNKLPFGISSAPELFQSRMNRLLEGLDGVLCHMDDVLIFASSEAEHATRLKLVLERLQNAGVTLNREKCMTKSSFWDTSSANLESEQTQPRPNRSSKCHLQLTFRS